MCSSLVPGACSLALDGKGWSRRTRANFFCSRRDLGILCSATAFTSFAGYSSVYKFPSSPLETTRQIHKANSFLGSSSLLTISGLRVCVNELTYAKQLEGTFRK